MIQIDPAAIFTSVMVLLAPLCLELTRDILGHVRNFLLGCYERIKRKLHPRVYLVISYTLGDDSFRVPPEHMESVNAMDNIFDYLTAKGVISSGSKLMTSKHRRKNKLEPHLTVKPLEGVTYEGLTFNFSQEEGETQPANGRGIAQASGNQVRLEISGKSFVDIKTFVDKCTADAIRKDNEPRKPRLYMQIDSPTPKFIRFKLKVSTTFDNIYLPNKQDIIDVVNNLRDGHRRKLAMLLYGKPGCGKTSLIKAIAGHLGYDVIIVKLSHMTCDTDILQVLHERCVSTRNGGVYSVSQKTIYVFEDIDAETDAIHTRGGSKVPSLPPIPAFSGDKQRAAAPPRGKTTDDLFDIAADASSAYKSKYGITLSGVLNALDGILEINKSLIILTSNHPEKLDPALLRPGRTDYKIELREMTAKCADQLIRSYLPRSLALRDYEITPAALHELLKDAPNIEWLATRVGAEVGRKIEVVA